SFHDFLTDRIASDGFSTEDALASFLPLAREVLDAHAAGLVAPLEGIGELRIDGVRIWFEEAKRQKTRKSHSAIRRVCDGNSSQLDIVSEWKRTSDSDQLSNLEIGQRGEPIERPVFLPGYVAWEHELDHHDPLTDVFSLGLILASLACGMDLTDAKDLESFVAQRSNPFQLNEDLHPVLARAIVRMTELDRHRRVQDLAGLVRNLENYRDQDVDFDIDLAQIPAFQQKNRTGKQAVVLAKLRERLFELSRRNRMLHFRPTLQTVNLTEASVPLSFDIQNIPLEQVVVWNGSFAKTVTAGKPISLNHHLNFNEALYLPHVLNKVITESRRDQAEFGFVQLRLVACFLRWSNLKEKPIEQYHSPLVLLPAKLTRKKGIRDTFHLQCFSTEAEINPVVRHQLKQLYDIDLPAEIDLSQWTLEDFYRHLAAKIGQQQSAVSLEMIDRPRIDLVHEKARRRLDQYRRRARIAGRGVRTFLDLDYSYDPANYHPLGIKLFSERIRPPSTRLRAIIEEKPRPRSFAAPADVPAEEKERTLYTLSQGEDNPYTWEFDLCNVTLSNFKYRKMSLVRDYDILLEDEIANPAFDATFSLVPRPVDDETIDVPSLHDRFDVVACDPTQATAIAEATQGKSYIIQGPPGTGKSQTITNLIADYVARGKRVLFVCEKRAAIDVVFARLQQCGLDDLCCLIHDSQADKKEFVMNLKRTYESFLNSNPDANDNEADSRDNVLLSIGRDLAPLHEFDSAMRQATPKAGIPTRQLLDRCIELSNNVPQLSPIEQEILPDFDTWRKHKPAIEKFASTLKEIQPDLIFSKHPLCRLSPRVAGVRHPLQLIDSSLQAARQAMQQLEQALQSTSIPRDDWNSIDNVRQLIQYAEHIAPIVEKHHMALLGETEQADKFLVEVTKFHDQQERINQAREATRNWKEKLPAKEVLAAITLVREFDKSGFNWLKSSWWRLRRVLNRAYNFRAHAVKPKWIQILTELEHEYDLLDELDKQRKELAFLFTIQDGVDDLIEQVVQLRSKLATLPDWLKAVHCDLVSAPDDREVVASITSARAAFDNLLSHLDAIIDDFGDATLDELRTDLTSLEKHLSHVPDFLQCLAQLSSVPVSIATPLRTLSLTPIQLEAATARATLKNIYRSDRALDQFSGAVRDHHVERLDGSYSRWLKANAKEIRQSVIRRFKDHIRTASQPTAQLSNDEKEFKKRYNRGRRELEHEFGKQMRYKPIRDLVAEESGDVVRDLKPVWLMSPLSVADTLPLDTDHVDVVIFDEASQITLEEAVPSIFRATQTIVVGDQMQLPPTDFFSAKRLEDDEELLVEEGGELIQYDLDSNSFLNHAAKNLRSTMLGWHYRSRSESLISFSNWAFYEGSLLTVPEESLPGPNQQALVAVKAEDAAENADELVARPVSFHSMQHGVYQRRRNRAEAEYIAPNDDMLHLAGVMSCIMCGACVSDCTVLEVDSNFLGPAALAKAYRFASDPRDDADSSRLGMLNQYGGVWDCTRCLKCVEV
ncbi:MAG: DUF4011 domain-containing protein, partial [Planctomycetes bacterium]|nr:DUF4011 domain-containing protein [Planctomycetota bacterium]